MAREPENPRMMEGYLLGEGELGEVERPIRLVLR
jgi:hypothetical protein